MKTIKRAKTELIDSGFFQKLLDKHTNLQLFTTNFSPILSTKRIVPRMRWLEFVYALPYLVLKREIFNSFKKYSFKPTFFLSLNTVPVKQRGVSLILQHLFTAEHTENTERQENQLLPGECRPSSFFVSSALSTVDKYILQKSDASLPPYGLLGRETLLNGQRITSYFKSPSPELAQPIGHETLTSRVETEKELELQNYQLPVVTFQPPVVSLKPSAVSYKNPGTYILSSTSDFTTPPFSYYSFKPLTTFFLSQKRVSAKQRGASILQKSDASLPPYGPLGRETLLNGQRIISYFKSPSLELAQPIGHETLTSRVETEKELELQNYQLPVVTFQPPVVSLKPSAVSYKNPGTYILSSTSDFTTPPFSYYSFKPLTTFFLSQKRVSAKQRGASILQKSDASLPPYGPLGRETLLNGQRIISYFKSPSLELAQPISHETATTTRIETEKELAIANYQLPVVTRLLSTLSHKTVSVSDKSLEKPSIFSSAEEFMNNKQGLLHTLEVEKAPTYHTYPEIEHVSATHTEIIKERVIEKEAEPPHATPQPPGIDVNRLAEQIYQLIERRVRIERERRGL